MNYYKAVVEAEFARLLKFVFTGDEMQNSCACINSFKQQALVEALGDRLAATILPCDQLMKRPAGDFVKGDEGRTLHAYAEAQNVFGFYIST